MVEFRTYLRQLRIAQGMTQLDLAERYVTVAELGVRYGPQHPVIVSLRAEIESLAHLLRPVAEQIDFSRTEHHLGDRLARTEAELAALSTRYGPSYPEVRAAMERAEAIKRALREIRAHHAFYGQ